MLKVPAVFLKMQPDFKNLDDKVFEGKTIRTVKHDRIDAKGREVGNFLVFDDVTAVVLPGQKVDVTTAASLGYVDDGNGRQLAVLHRDDLIDVLRRHTKLSSVLSNDATTHAVNAQVQREQGGVGGVAGVVQETGSLSGVLPLGCFAVSSQNASMYGKKMRDLHIGGFSVENNRLDDRVIRFRKSDHKVVAADVLVAVGKYDLYKNAHRAVLKLTTSDDDKVTDLTTLEIDTTLVDTVST